VYNSVKKQFTVYLKVKTGLNYFFFQTKRNEQKAKFLNKSLSKKKVLDFTKSSNQIN